MQFDIKKEEDRNKLACEVAFYMMSLGYRESRKFLYIPDGYISSGGFPLGEIWSELQDLYNQNQLSEEEIRFLLRLRMRFADSPQKDLEIWLNRADEAEEYYKKNGTLSMPNTTLFHDGVSMFQWIHHQKKSYKMGELSMYQRERLENMGIQWIKPKQVVGWEKGYSYAKQFFEENGHLFVRNMLLQMALNLANGYRSRETGILDCQNMKSVMRGSICWRISACSGKTLKMQNGIGLLDS